MSAPKYASVIYFLLGQLGWLVCIVSAARGLPWIGVIAVAILIATHLLRVPRRLEEAEFLVTVTVIGALWESVLVRCHLLSYPSGVLIDGAAPYWIVAVWALFAAQFNTCYVWLKHRIGLASVLGAIAGPASFRAGAAMGAVNFERPWPAALALACGWACLLPLLVILSRRWDGAEVRQSPLDLEGSS